MSGPQTEEEELDMQLAANWEDIGGTVSGLTSAEIEHIAVTMFGCPESNE
tara:strand:- start:255 stop:404 length:150 start_codon:yes stop_codon:yes gene_type:complete